MSSTKQQFSCYNPIKTSFLVVVVAPAAPFPFQFHTGHLVVVVAPAARFPFQFHTGHAMFGFIDVQYLRNYVFFALKKV